MSENKVTLKVGGMTCTGCANTVKNALEKEGANDVFVDFSMGEAVFNNPSDLPVEKFIKTIEKSGYFVKSETEEEVHEHHQQSKWLFIISACFTAPLLLHMVLPFAWMHNVMFQFALSTPVLIIGLYKFGKSAWQSVVQKSPNMDVLILTGALAAYLYSIAGWLINQQHEHIAMQYVFFETTASIITFVMLGNLLEDYSVSKTTRAIKNLQKANEIKFATKKTEQNNQVSYEKVTIEDIQIGDIIVINEGDQVPLDCKILSGTIEVNESIISGESIPVFKSEKSELIGGSTIVKGAVEAYVIRKKSDTILAQIIQIVKKAQRDKTKIQKLGDKIAAIFVPVVIGLSILTFVLNYSFGIAISGSILRSIAVLVISCPCAMGLAAPTAVSVALGIAAKNKILFKTTASFELLYNSQVFVFDKTGTITTGDFTIESFKNFSTLPDEKIWSLLYSAEMKSNHPIAKAIVKAATQRNAKGILLIDYKEEKGIGTSFREFNSTDNIVYELGSFRILQDSDLVHKNNYDIFLTANHQLLAGIQIRDEIKDGVKEAINYLISKNKKIYILSGDKKDKCLWIAKQLNLSENNIYYEKLPQDKIQIIEQLKQYGKICMTGDGINDAPSLATADVSVSFNNSSHIAIDSASIIISGQDTFNHLVNAYDLSALTIKKIKQNYFWAFIYNIIAIPIAGLGFLQPIFAALIMTFSDVVVVGNSLMIFRYKKKP